MSILFVIPLVLFVICLAGWVFDNENAFFTGLLLGLATLLFATIYTDCKRTQVISDSPVPAMVVKTDKAAAVVVNGEVYTVTDIEEYNQLKNGTNWVLVGTNFNGFGRIISTFTRTTNNIAK